VKLLECSVTTPADTQPAGRCDAATGTCECAAYDDHTFVPPSDGDGDYANSGMYSSTQLGFGACAARIDFVDLGVGADSQSRGKVFHNQTLSPGRWRFYKFDVDPANDHQVVISMNKEISAGSWEKNYASLYVRHETVPTNHWGHYDLPQDFVTGADASVLVTLTEGDEIYQPGTWYVLGFPKSRTTVYGPYLTVSVHYALKGSALRTSQVRCSARLLLLFGPNPADCLLTRVTVPTDTFFYNHRYAGVFASGGTDASFTVSFDVFDCPMNCSDRGTCVVAANGTRVCHCDLDRNGNPYLKNDCSEEFSNWLPGGDEDENGAASFRVNGTLASAEYDYFALPVMDLRESKRQIELVLSASFSKENLMYDWEEKPALLLKKGLIGDDNGRNQFPSITDYAFKVTLDEFDVEYKIELCAAQFATGVWNAAVYNPERVEPMRYTVSFRKHGVCPSVNELECSGHGACRANDASDPNFATCDCHAGWTASDCAFPSCPDGSFIKLPPGTDGGDHATCFRGCQGGKRRATGCDEILCVSPARAAEGSGETGEKKCVVDECESDLFHVDQDKDLSCVFRCAADSGDLLSPKRLSETCDPATVRSNANAISGDNDDGGATGWLTLAFVVALLVAVGGGAVAVARGAAGDQSVGDRLARFVTYVRNGFTIDTWDRRNDAYEDVDAFERADFD
jgi:hypothetical protein